MKDIVCGIEILFLGVGTFFDLKDREIPIWFLMFFVSCGLVCNTLWRYQSMEQCLGVCVMGGVFLLVGWITRWAIGPADSVGFIVLGLLKGWKEMLGLVFAAFVLSGIYGICKIKICHGTLRDEMPFFPFLFLACIGDLVV